MLRHNVDSRPQPRLGLCTVTSMFFHDFLFFKIVLGRVPAATGTPAGSGISLTTRHGVTESQSFSSSAQIGSGSRELVTKARSGTRKRSGILD